MPGAGTATVKVRAIAAALGCFLFSAVAAGAIETTVLTTAEGLPSNWVTALAIAPDGKLWIGTGDAGLHVIDPATGKGRGYRAADGLSSDSVVSVAFFGGKAYVGTAAALSILDGGSWRTIDKVENVTMRNVRVAASPDGKQLWACSVYLAGGTVRLEGNAWKFMGGEGRGLFNDVQGFAFLPEGVLLGDGSGAAYLHTGTDVRPLAEGFPAANVFSAAAYKGKGFLGTARGLFEYEGRWKRFSLPPGVAGSPVFALAVKGDRLVAGTANGLASSGGGAVKSMGTADGLPAARVTAVAIGTDYVAAGTARGVALIRGW
jgi:ligand-binding sensor domain-containing protein